MLFHYISVFVRRPIYNGTVRPPADYVAPLREDAGFFQRARRATRSFLRETVQETTTVGFTV